MMENIIKINLNKKVIKLKALEFYTIKTSFECVEELLLENSNLDKEKTIIINSFSKYLNTILVPIYFKKHKPLLKQNGLNFNYGVNNSKCFKILISNEKNKYSTILVNTIGLDYENIKELRDFLINLKNVDIKTIFLVNYNSNNQTELEIYDETDNLIYTEFDTPER